jgi:hypothetical protein
MNFQGLTSALKNRLTKKLARNTYARRNDEKTIAIQLHQTDILTFSKSGKVVLNSGNWRTPTTKDRLNSYLPEMYISQLKGQWFLHKQGENAATYFFEDGMIVSAKTGKVNAKPYQPTNKKAKAEAKLRKDTLNFVKAYVNALFNGEVERPGPGDCFFCYIVDVEIKKPLPGHDHLLEHIRESYFVPSMLYNAANDFPGLLSVITEDTVARLLEKTEVSDFAVSISKRQVTACLRKYLYTQLGLAS